MNRNDFSFEEKMALKELKDSLKGLTKGPIRLILFGSRARGDYGRESDVDIAIIVHDLTRKLKNEILDKVADIELKYLTPLSTWVISQNDFDFLKKRERRISLDIEREGIPL